jgi:hypothetical protein
MRAKRSAPRRSPSASISRLHPGRSPGRARTGRGHRRIERRSARPGSFQLYPARRSQPGRAVSRLPRPTGLAQRDSTEPGGGRCWTRTPVRSAVPSHIARADLHPTGADCWTRTPVRITVPSGILGGDRHPTSADCWTRTPVRITVPAISARPAQRPPNADCWTPIPVQSAVCAASIRHFVVADGPRRRPMGRRPTCGHDPGLAYNRTDRCRPRRFPAGHEPTNTRPGYAKFEVVEPPENLSFKRGRRRHWPEQPGRPLRHPGQIDRGREARGRPACQGWPGNKHRGKRHLLLRRPEQGVGDGP